MFVYLKLQVRDEADGSKADQEQVSEDEGSGGVDDLLNLFVGATGLTRLPIRTQQNKIESGFFYRMLFLLILFGAYFMCASPPLVTLVTVVLAVFELPVHDLADHRRGDQTQKLEHAKDGRVNAH